MANALEKGTLFPAELTNEMFSLVKGKSSLARMSNSEPIPFNGKELFTFNFDKEIDVVGESGAKSNGGADIQPVTIKPIKVEYGMRVSDEFKYAADEARLPVLRAFMDGFAAKVAKGFDLMAMHGINPRTGNAASTVIGNNHFDYVVTRTVRKGDSANTTVENAVALIQEKEWEARGLVMSPALRAALAQEKDNTNKPIFPQLAWGATPPDINGLPVDTNGTVSFGNSEDIGIIGDFAACFRWGYAKDVFFKIIEYGNPDNDPEAGDLAGHNQIYIRGEAYIGWGILVSDAFARILKAPSVTLNKATASVAAGSTVSLTATTYPSDETVTWTSDKESVATVSSGTVTGVAEGTATITASITVGGITTTASCKVTVTAASV